MGSTVDSTTITGFVTRVGAVRREYRWQSPLLSACRLCRHHRLYTDKTQDRTGENTQNEQSQGKSIEHIDDVVCYYRPPLKKSTTSLPYLRDQQTKTHETTIRNTAIEGSIRDNNDDGMME
jgi:hypothetical protein